MIPTLLEAAIKADLGSFTSHPLQGGSSANNSIAYTLRLTSESDRSYVLKIPQNAYAVSASDRERANLPRLQEYISTSSASEAALAVPTLALSEPLPLNSLLTRTIPGIDGAQAWNRSTTTEERLSLARAYGRTARWVHSFDPSSDLLPGPLRTGPISSAKDWLDIYAKAEDARLAPKLADKSPMSEKEPIAKACLAAMTGALEQPELWIGGRGDLCFVHGDFTLPNVMVSRSRGDGGWKEVGIVDWGDCGIADRRYDLRMGVWSIRYNCLLAGEDNEGAKREYVRAFLEAYGVAWVREDWEKSIRVLGTKGKVVGGVKCWEAWGAAYHVWGLLGVDDEEYSIDSL